MTHIIQAFRRVIACIELILFYSGQVVLSNVRVAWDILHPNPKINPGIFTISMVPLCQREAVIAANLISMTPGTLSLHYEPETSELTIHTLYIDEKNQLIETIHNQWLRRVNHTFGNASM